MTEQAVPVQKRITWLWLLAIAMGGVAGLLHLIGKPDPYGGGTLPVVIGQGGLFSAPLFLGILAGIARTEKANRTALALSAVCLIVAAPMLGEGLMCLILIVPVHLIIGPLAAWITSLVVRARRRKRAGALGAETLLLLVPFALAAADRIDPPARPAPISLTDSVVVDVPRNEVWRSIETLHIQFVHPVPWVIRIGLPVPVEIVGGGAHVGAERRVVFRNGVVLATVIHAQEPERFVVRLAIERAGREFFDHWSVLGNSTFELQELPGGRTRITHSTSYTPLSLPRWYFEPIERRLGRTVQRYMIEAYAKQVFDHPSTRALPQRLAFR